MQVTRFRVKNYKSIIDSGDCFLGNKVTILAGKNESGKSSLLEALEDFNADRPIREKSIPIQDESLKPEITVWLRLSPDELNATLEAIGLDKIIGISDIEICVTKSYPQEFAVVPKSLAQLNVTAVNHSAAISQAFAALDSHADFRTIAQSIGHPIPSESEADAAAQLRAMQKWQAKAPQLINNWAPEVQEPLKEAVQGVVSALQRAVGAKDAGTNLASAIVARMPNFICLVRSTTYSPIGFL